MIERYTSPEMGGIFSLENKYRIWQLIELAACEAQFELGELEMTADELRWIQEHASFDVDEIAELEELTRHDVIAFLTNLGQHIDADYIGHAKPSRWVHFGMTSSDLGDTALCYQLRQASDRLIEQLKDLIKICTDRAFESRDMLCVGRTHGIHAEPMTFGMKFASWAWELHRNYERLQDARADIATGAISGAVGTYSSINPAVEQKICEKLGLQSDPISTQVISRDRHAYLAASLACVAASCERIALEIRNHQRSDTLEAEEPFRRGQKGSSAMPHKRNPITAEKVCGLARIVKANAQVSFDNVALWHERDISHSSTERIALADSFIALDHMLSCLKRIVGGLVLYPERMLANLNKTRGLIYSSKVLLACVEAGMSREEAYALVQETAMQVWEDVQLCREGGDFLDRLAQNPSCPLSKEVLAEAFDPQAFLLRSSVIFDRLAELKRLYD